MKERPIIFGALMVKALLAGNKTQTRRIIKPQPSVLASDGRPFKYKFVEQHLRDLGKTKVISTEQDGPFGDTLKCPYGQPGDILWVRESFRWIEGNLGSGVYDFKADQKLVTNLSGYKPPIHMPKEASRIWLQVKDVRVERLHDVNWMDATKEGITMEMLKGADPHLPVSVHILQEFKNIWGSINGEESWNDNPWLWVVTFKVLCTTGRTTP